MFHFQPPKSRSAGIHAQHTNNLRHVLRTALLAHESDSTSYALAYTSARALLQRQTNDSKRGRSSEASATVDFELMWRVGTDLLRSTAPYRAQLEDEDDEGNALQLLGDGWGTGVQHATGQSRSDAVRAARQLLRFLAQMSGVDAKLSSHLLLEMILYHMRFGMYEEAYNRLQGYISSYPYNENPVLIGYAGVLSYLLWRREANRAHYEEMDSQWDYSQSQISIADWSQHSLSQSANDIGTAEEGDLASRHYSNAIQHFEISLFLDNSSDMFLLYYLKLIAAAGDFDTAREKLRKFISDNAGHPNGYLYLLQLYHKRFPESLEWIPLAHKLLELDPVCNPKVALMPLVEHLEVTASSTGDDLKVHIERSLSIVTLIADRLDHERGNVWMWEKLAYYLSRLRRQDSIIDQALWGERRQWWPAFHYSSTGSTMEALLAVAKAICAFYIFPDEYPSLWWLQRFTLTPENLTPPSKSLIQQCGIQADLLFETVERRLPECFLNGGDQSNTDILDVLRIATEQGFDAELATLGERSDTPKLGEEKKHHSPSVLRDNSHQTQPEPGSFSPQTDTMPRGSDSSQSLDEIIVFTQNHTRIVRDDGLEVMFNESISKPFLGEATTPLVDNDNIEEKPTTDSRHLNGTFGVQASSKRKREVNDTDNEGIVISSQQSTGTPYVQSSSIVSPANIPPKKRTKRVKGF